MYIFQDVYPRAIKAHRGANVNKHLHCLNKNKIEKDKTKQATIAGSFEGCLTKLDENVQNL